MDLDFSVFHPLDHWPWEKRCSEFHGGWRWHLKIAWHFRRREQVLWPWNRLLCTFDKHRWIRGSRQLDDGVWVSIHCRECRLSRAATDEEIKEALTSWHRHSKRLPPEGPGAS